MKDGRIDYTEFSEMVDIFMAEGFNYFDTARVYHVILYVPDIRRKRKATAEKVRSSRKPKIRETDLPKALARAYLI